MVLDCLASDYAVRRDGLDHGRLNRLRGGRRRQYRIVFEVTGRLVRDCSIAHLFQAYLVVPGSFEVLGRPSKLCHAFAERAAQLR